MPINATGADEFSVSGSRSSGGSSDISELDVKELYICPRSFLNHWTVDIKVRSRQAEFIPPAEFRVAGCISMDVFLSFC